MLNLLREHESLDVEQLQRATKLTEKEVRDVVGILINEYAWPIRNVAQRCFGIDWSLVTLRGARRTG